MLWRRNNCWARLLSISICCYCFVCLQDLCNCTTRSLHLHSVWIDLYTGVDYGNINGNAEYCEENKRDLEYLRTMRKTKNILIPKRFKEIFNSLANNLAHQLNVTSERNVLVIRRRRQALCKLSRTYWVATCCHYTQYLVCPERFVIMYSQVFCLVFSAFEIIDFTRVYFK